MIFKIFTYLCRLEEISELVSSCLSSPLRREKLATAIENDNYIKKLLNIFHICEDLENLDGLHHLYEIFRWVALKLKSLLKKFNLLIQEHFPAEQERAVRGDVF